jgi:hypothetical protein
VYFVIAADHFRGGHALVGAPCGDSFTPIGAPRVLHGYAVQKLVFTSRFYWAPVKTEFLLANPATQEKACARPTVLSDLARAQEMKMRQTEKMYVMDVPTICLLTLQNDTTGTNQLPLRPDAKKHRLPTISRSDAV